MTGPPTTEPCAKDNRRKARRRFAVVVGLVALGVAITLIVWPASCPISLAISGMEPSGIAEDSGSEFALCYITLRNLSSKFVILNEASFEVEARVEGNWEPVQGSSAGGVRPRGTSEVLALIPPRADALRLRFAYDTFTRPFGEKLFESSPGLYRGLYRVPGVGSLLLSGSYSSRWLNKQLNPHWRTALTPEVLLPTRPRNGAD